MPAKALKNHDLSRLGRSPLSLFIKLANSNGCMKQGTMNAIRDAPTDLLETETGEFSA